MLTHDFTTVILDLKEANVRKAEKVKHIHVELPRRKYKCLKCGEWTDGIHDYRMQKINVKYFVTDMNPHFKAVGKACFHNATIVADHYHVIRQAVWAMENVRKREQKRLSSNISSIPNY